MAVTKALFTQIRKFLVSILLLLLWFSISAAADLEWQSMTSFKDVRRMRLIDDTLYMATSGGLLINEFNNTSSPGIELSNVDGLGTVDITDVMVDSSGQKWVTGMGRLLRFEYAVSVPYLFFDQNNNLIKLHCAADDGDFIWVGTEIGLVLFSKIEDGGQIQDSYTLFDSLNPSPEVFDIYLDGDTIWIATSAGLARADKSIPLQLKSPSNWKTYDRIRYPELGSDRFSRIIQFENTFYAATSSGLYNLERTAADTFLIVPFGQSSAFSELKIENDSLFFYSPSVFGVIIGGAASLLPTPGLTARPTTGAGNGSFRWVNIRNVGVYQNSSGSYQLYPYTGLPGNTVTDLTVNADGVITAGFGISGGGRYANGQWSTFPLNAASTLAELDPSGEAWLGTFGFGLWRIGSGVPVNYDENNTTLRGNTDRPPEGQTFVVIAGLKISGGYLYAACYRALNIYPVAIGSLNNLNSFSGWDSIGTNQGIANELVTSLDVYEQFVAVGTEGVGLYECNVGADPSNTSDDNCILLTDNNSFLASNSVRTVKYSPAGELWAGTNFGLSRFDFGIERFVNVGLPAGIGADIRILEFDSRGNVWAGSDNGLVYVNNIDGTAEFFNEQNSGLVANAVRNIHYDSFTGKVYAATNAGISIISSTIGTPTSEVSTVVAFPNPFVIDSPADELEFNFSENGVVRLYSIAGELIREIQIGQKWNGKNEQGQDVVSGVYVFVLTDDGGNIGRGKILLIRK